jgi:predicted ferric reductase
MQNGGQNHNITIANTTFENVVKLEYLGMKITNQNLIDEKMMSRLNLGNAYYFSVQRLLSSWLLSKNIKIKTYKIIILPVVMYSCETWHLTLRKNID